MSAAVLAAALALLVAPTTSARGRLRRRPAPGRSRPGAAVVRRGSLPAAVAGAIVVAAVAGPAAGIATALVALTTRLRLRHARRSRRRDREQRALLAGLEIAVAELRVGTHPAAACAAAAEESKGAAAEAFRGAAATARLGGSAARGLVAGRGGGGADTAAVLPDLERVAGPWRIAEEHGIALAELLDAARSDLLGRIRFRGRVEAGMAGARATAAVLAGLPLLGVALGQMMGAAPVAVLLSGGLGGVLLVIGTAFGCAGLLWTDRITGKVTA
ncbi:hypothetical protein GCM10023094_04120 [Rhodococcus olei]|uniref:Type II secretion system protein F (GspF) n=1 Tax=Rhodococcus olei TaxID=2161675 RepID=A0ABP8NW19_9NOCA